MALAILQRKFGLLLLAACQGQRHRLAVARGSEREVARLRFETTPLQSLLPRAGSGSAVDIFNASSGKWTTAALSVARYYLAATSLPNQRLAIFAGGQGL